MLVEPAFYLAAVPAVLLFGIAKGGFGGGLGVVAVPLMSLVTSPIQAAAILLPILCLMDLVSLWAYRGRWVWPELRILLPAALFGIGIGTLVFEYLSPAILKLLLGIVAISFCVNHWLRTNYSTSSTRLFGRVAATIAATSSGFTSFIAHAGGPPLAIYLLRRGLNRTEFVATTVVFFLVINYVKLVPYAWLGQFDLSNLMASLILAPLAPIGIAMGVWLHNRVTDRLFFQVAYVMLLVVGVKLIVDGITGVQ